MRFSLGVAVFSGMLGVTAFGLLFTPVFYALIMRFAGEKKPSAVASVEKVHAAEEKVLVAEKA